MRPFIYQKVTDISAATRAGNTPDAAVAFLAGGTTLLDLMKLDVMKPRQVIDINSVANDLSAIAAADGRLSIGALARMSDVAAHADVQKNFPAIADSLKLAASPQIRNMATMGGNVLQRTRCSYFRDVSYTNCNKRIPGSGCAALEGVNRNHAVLGTSDACIATYPGDFAQAFIALDGLVEISGASGQRKMPFAQLHRLPADKPDVETVLQPGDLITGFTLDRPWPRSSYVKIRDRESYEFALASVAVGLDISNGTITDARIALGGVATIPWRAFTAEQVLRGQTFSDDLAAKAAQAAFAEAKTREHNSYKVELGRRAVIRALKQTVAMEI